MQGVVDEAYVRSGKIKIIAKDFETLTVDGIPMEFQNTPGTYPSAKMMTRFPDLKAFRAAGKIVGTIHNIDTLRDALEWSKQIIVSLYRYGQEAKVMVASHCWPGWGNHRIQEVMQGQRDTCATLNNGVLNLANQGVTINQVHNIHEVPKSLQQQWVAR
jgi:alkyl sulfatase BDS1-like metallo-beta-lactamase superfamily hydrolase